MKYTIEYCKEDKIFICTSLDYPCCKTHGDSEEDAIKEMKILSKALKETKA